jgi:hypothetical protein
VRVRGIYPVIPAEARIHERGAADEWGRTATLTRAFLGPGFRRDDDAGEALPTLRRTGTSLHLDK